MKAFVAPSKDQPPTLIETSHPARADGSVRIKIAACGLNFADLLVAKGQYQDKYPHPVTLGMELSGEVIESDAPTLPTGQRVAVFSGTGGLAEEGCFPAARCVPLPHTMPFVEAAGFQVAYGSSHLALAKAGLKPGERLLVLGAAGGVGLTAVELGKLMGAEVIAVARGEAKLQIARRAGADVTLDSERADLKGQLKALGGVDVVYDPVGGALFKPALSALRPEGRYLLIGFASGDLPEIRPNHLLVKNVSVIGFWWGGYLNFNAAALTDSLAQLFEWYAAGKIKPHISHVLPLDQAAEGLELLRSRKATGKVVITCG